VGIVAGNTRDLFALLLRAEGEALLPVNSDEDRLVALMLALKLPASVPYHRPHNVDSGAATMFSPSGRSSVPS